MFGYQPKCYTPCKVAEVTLDGVVDRTLGWNRSDEVNVRAPSRERADMLLPSFLFDLCARIDEELGAGVDHKAQSHEQSYEMWQTFQQVVGSHDFRMAVRRHHASVGSPSLARCFEAILEKPAGKKLGFVINKVKCHKSVLVVDEIKMEGVLDVWNRHMHESGKTMFCIQPLAVLVSVNGVSGDHSAMAQELMKTQVVLHVVNPPTVLDAVGLYDVLKEGFLHPAPFWESGAESEGEGDDVQHGPPAEQRPGGAPGVRKQLPEFSSRGSGEDSGSCCRRPKNRQCVNVQQMEECLDPIEPLKCGAQSANSGVRRNMF